MYVNNIDEVLEAVISINELNNGAENFKKINLSKLFPSRRILYQGLCFQSNLKDAFEGYDLNDVNSIIFFLNFTKNINLKFEIEDPNQVDYRLQSFQLKGKEIIAKNTTEKSFHIKTTVFDNLDQCVNYRQHKK